MAAMPLLWLALAVLVPAPHSGSAALAGAAIVLTALLVAMLAARLSAGSLLAVAASPPVPRHRRVPVTTPRLADPDAAGRPRPRAPTSA
jgi:hypothetical protein